MGFNHLVIYDNKLGQYFPTREFEDTSPGMGFVEKFENEIFWNELIERLAERDLIKKHGEDGVLTMGLEERFSEQNSLESQYSSEFEVNGLEHVSIRQCELPELLSR